jgi:hypothetical protein
MNLIVTNCYCKHCLHPRHCDHAAQLPLLHTMFDLNFADFEAYILISVALVTLLYTLFRENKDAALKITGEKTEGIIFDMGRKSGPVTNSNLFDKVTIRFVTKTSQWITANIDQDVTIFYTGQYKCGDTVDVYYDKANPGKFLVDTKQSESKARILFVVVGFVFVLARMYKLLTT